MVIYGYIVLVLCILVIGIEIGKTTHSDDPRKLLAILGDLLVILPLIGRVLGWW